MFTRLGVHGLLGHSRGLLPVSAVLRAIPTMSDPSVPHHEKHRQPPPFLGTLVACVILVIVIIVFGIKVHRLNAQVDAAQKQATDSKSETAKVQSDLDKAKSQSEDLQAQLVKAKAQSADLQARLDQSKDAATQMQSQLEKDKTQSADLLAQLGKSKAQSADLENQLRQATAGSTQLLTQLDQAKIQTMDLQSRLQTAENDLSQLQPMLLKARHMPVTASVEKIHGGRSFTLHVNNLYVQPLSVNITITGSGKTRSQSNVIGTGATLDIEKLAAGDNVTIASEGYEAVKATAQ